MLSTPGIADFGVVRDIRIQGEPLPAPKAPDLGDIEEDLEEIFGRWRR